MGELHRVMPRQEEWMQFICTRVAHALEVSLTWDLSHPFSTSLSFTLADLLFPLLSSHVYTISPQPRHVSTIHTKCAPLLRPPSLGILPTYSEFLTGTDNVNNAISISSRGPHGLMAVSSHCRQRPRSTGC